MYRDDLAAVRFQPDDPAVFDPDEVDIEAKADHAYDFRVTGSVLKFDGFSEV